MHAPMHEGLAFSPLLPVPYRSKKRSLSPIPHSPPTLQVASGDAHRPQPAYHSLPAQDTSDVGLDDAAPGSLLPLVERRQLFLHALALHLELGEGCLQRSPRLQHGP